ncbi:MAG: SDR family oxidoreductase, partial [Acidimicrobiia bacterium]|nr:SDR family oxidoreductase [Acidimicrobiia bacterium]
MPTAVVTGGTRGLGRTMVEHLVSEGWRVVFDARRNPDVERMLAEIDARAPASTVVGISGDVTDALHRSELARATGDGGLDLLVNNAGALGPTPLPRLVDVAPSDLSDLFDTNVIAPIRLVSEMLTSLQRCAGIVVNISSDAAVEAYEGWGAYGASKAALDHVSKVLADEHPDLSVYAFDPGDMRTNMYQSAFPGEDISDRPLPESVVPLLMRLVKQRPPSGRYTRADMTMQPAP